MSFQDDMLTDLSVFFNPDEFGRQAIYKGNTIQGQLFSEYESAALFESSVESRKTWFVARSSDVLDAVHGDTLTIDGVAYKIIEIEPEDSGITALRLGK